MTIALTLPNGGNGYNSMPFTSFPDVIQVEANYTWASQFCQNVVQYKGSITPTPVNVLPLLAEFVTKWNATMKVYMPSDLSLTGLKVLDLSSQSGWTLFYQTGLPIAGTSAGASLPNNCAVVLTKRTFNRGRSYRGRIYQPGLTELHTTSNQVQGTPLAAMLAFWDDMRFYATGVVDYQMVVASRFQNHVQLSVGEATDVTGITSDGVVDSQRRRLPGRGK